MTSISPRKADNEALDIINRVIQEKRTISEFESVRVVNCLRSLYKAGSPYYDEIAACYYSQIADVDNLILTVSNVFNHNKEDSYFNSIYALNNTMRYKEIYKYIRDYNLLSDNKDFLMSAIKASSFCADADLATRYISEYKRHCDEDSDVFLAQISELNDFFDKNHKIKDCISNYMLDCFDVFSREILSRAKEIDSSYGFSHHVFYDEGYDFVAFSFIWNGDDSKLDYLIDLEDSFISSISKIKCEPIIKTKLSFNFEMGELL
ncbi:hypothetical protein EJE24_00815 [Enterobacter huaxiensis]|uniref:Uncharacterized protein n=1 Tax=Enterobacter huaxiensis TaxID=2494702 RepID=A0A428LY65_9ENTR|nr:hypothetical protein [Enterobacter huaxiensis]RSK70348.1 hypothetical protein EJE24_00815 [Enterobacter huaxiensis]